MATAPKSHLKTLKTISRGTKIKLLNGAGTIIVTKKTHKTKLKTQLKGALSS